MVHSYIARGGSRLLKRGGHSQIYDHVDVELVRIYTVMVCMGMRSMLTLGGLGACPPGNFEKLPSLRLNLRAFLVIDHPLMLL